MRHRHINRSMLISISSNHSVGAATSPVNSSNPARNATDAGTMGSQAS